MSTIQHPISRGSFSPLSRSKKRVQEMARQISADFHGKTLHVVGVMENGFIFTADLVRQLTVPRGVSVRQAGSLNRLIPAPRKSSLARKLTSTGQHVPWLRSWCNRE